MKVLYFVQSGGLRRIENARMYQPMTDLIAHAFVEQEEESSPKAA